MTFIVSGYFRLLKNILINFVSIDIKNMKKFFSLLFVVLLIAGGIYVYPMAKIYLEGIKKVNTTSNLDFYVATGDNIDDIAEKLKENKVIDDVEAFKNYATARNLKESTIEPGKYLIKSGATLNEVVTNFRLGYGEKEVKLTFNNTRTLSEIAEKITKNIEVTPEEFLSKISNGDVQAKYGFNKHTIRTIFIPNTYNVYWDITPDELMDRIAKEYKAFWNDERKAKAKAIGLSQSEVSTLASIVLTETAKKEDAPIIAGVYMNRIELGMPLQADPTLIFALGDFSIKRVLDVDKQIESPYNTYKYRGLPPGPIYVAPISYLDAVLNYQKHDYLYFCAKETLDGYSNFSKTYTGHLVNARNYQAALNKQKVYR